MRAFGLRVVRASPALALALGCATIGLGIAAPGLLAFWLAQLALGVAVAPLLVLLYRTEDVMYAAAYGAVLGVTTPLLAMGMLGSFTSSATIFSPIPFGAGVALVFAARKRYLVQALELDA